MRRGCLKEQSPSNLNERSTFYSLAEKRSSLLRYYWMPSVMLRARASMRFTYLPTEFALRKKAILRFAQRRWAEAACKHFAPGGKML